ncbi:MAG: iron-sulfur cluster assembly scaffold protein, partial [Planctomycetota bacterium]|nr:iron-sulfur cluster assembly scaffold protein [Planctomycetota bacterium]
MTAFPVRVRLREERERGALDKKDTHVGTGIVGAPECGDVMKLQIQV